MGFHRCQKCGADSLYMRHAIFFHTPQVGFHAGQKLSVANAFAHFFVLLEILFLKDVAREVFYLSKNIP